MSKINGIVSKITALSSFVKSYVQDEKNPNPASFKAFPNVRVTLATDLPAGFSNSFIPSMSIHGNADAAGKFQLDVGSLGELNNKAYFIVYAPAGTIKVPLVNTTIPIFAPIYRSATFALKSTSSTVQKIWVSPQTADEDDGFSQSAIDGAVGSAKTELNKKGAQIDSLSAFVRDGEVHISGSGRGATFKFDVSLAPSTGHNLNQFLKHEMKNFDIDLPGPDVFTTICVDEDAIQQQINSGISGLVSGFNATVKTRIIDEIAKSTGLPAPVVKTFFDNEMSMTFQRFRYPVTGEKKIGFVTVPVRTIVGDPCLGFPRKLFA